MFTGLVLITVTIFTFVTASADTTYIVEGRETTNKVDAIRALINNPNAAVKKCDDQELTDKATLRKK